MALVISSEVVIGTPEEEEALQPLSYPRILYHDILRIPGTTVVASSESTDFEAENVGDYLTWDFWRPAELPATLTITTPEAETVDYALIAAHTIGSTMTAVKLEYFDGSDWVALFETAPGVDNVIVALFDAVTTNQFRLSLAGSSIPSIGVVMLGRALAMQRKLYQGHGPITLSKRTVKLPNRSEGGQWLGASIRREGVQTSISFAHLTASWVRSKFEPFIESARKYPFGWVWRPEEFPAEVAYVQAIGDIRPTNSGPRDMMSVTFEVEGLIR